jgi:hypothetical protein
MMTLAMKAGVLSMMWHPLLRSRVDALMSLQPTIVKRELLPKSRRAQIVTVEAELDWEMQDVFDRQLGAPTETFTAATNKPTIRSQLPDVKVQKVLDNLERTAVAQVLDKINADSAFRGYQISELFRKLDENGDKRLSHLELKRGLQDHLGLHLSDSELDAFIRAVDADHNGWVDLAEFEELLHSRYRPVQAKADAQLYGTSAAYDGHGKLLPWHAVWLLQVDLVRCMLCLPRVLRHCGMCSGCCKSMWHGVRQRRLFAIR